MVVPDRTALISLGTSGVACLRSETQTHDPSGVVAGFADATGAFLPLVCTLNGARNLVAMAKALNVSLDEFSALAVSAPAGSEGLVFLPYLEGERTPPLPDARGELRGATLSNLTAANLARATIEGVLWSLAYGVQVLREQASPVDQVDADRRGGPVAGGSDHRGCRLRRTGAGHRPVREPSPSAPPGRPPGR